MNASSDKRQTEELAERYDREARYYARYWAPVLHRASCRLVDAHTPATARHVIDVGAGAGTLLPVLRDRFPDALIVAVDRSEGMLGLAASEAPVAVMDALELALAAASFDLAVMSFMLFHLPDPVSGLRDVRRVLEAGGRVCLSTWAADMDAQAVRVWNDELDTAGAPAAAELGRLANHDIMDTTDKVEGLLSTAGFGSARAVYHDFEYEMSLDDFVALRTNVGGPAERLRSLSRNTQRRFVESVRGRLVALSPDDFNLRMKVVLASATVPPE